MSLLGKIAMVRPVALKVSILWLMTIGLALSYGGLQSLAQACGPSITKISVQDEKGWPVLNADLELIAPSGKSIERTRYWSKTTDSTYEVGFYLAKPPGQHLLRVSKENLLSAEIPLTFGEAQFRVFEVVLANKESGKASSVRQLFPITGMTRTEDGIVIENVSVTAEANGGGKYKSKSDSEGRYELALPPGRYVLRFTRLFFHDHALEVDVVFVDRSLMVDVTLKGRGPTSH